MPLSKEVIEEYKKIYKKEFGEEISDEEAHEQGGRLLRLSKTIYRPMPKDKKKEFKKTCNEQK